MAWKITYGEEVYREVDLTLDEVERIEGLTGSSWLHITPLRSAKQAKAILAVMHASRTERGIDDVLGEVGSLKADAFIDMVEMEDLEAQLDLPTEYEDGIPKAEGGSTTPG